MSTGRAVPFYCPYCGEEDLVPEVGSGSSGEGHGHWSCRSCLRGFRLSLTAVAAPAVTAAPALSTAPARPSSASSPPPAPPAPHPKETR